MRVIFSGASRTGSPIGCNSFLINSGIDGLLKKVRRDLFFDIAGEFSLDNIARNLARRKPAD